MKIWILLFLIMAAIYDYRDFKIPNKLNGAGALITMVLAGVSYTRQEKGRLVL